MTERSRQGWVVAALLGAARFVIALAVYGAAELCSIEVADLPSMPLWLVLVATAVVATLFWLIRDPLRGLVDRLVLGERAEGYEAGRLLLRRMATTLAVDEIVPALAEAAARTMHSSRAEVRLLLSDGEPWSQVWPERAVSDGSPVTVGVRHAGTAVGEIEVDVPDAVEQDRDRMLLDDLARPAGLALSTARLTVELRRRAAELQDITEKLARSNHRIIDARRSEIARLDSEMRERVLPHLDRAQAALQAGPPVVDPNGAGDNPAGDNPAGPEPDGPEPAGLVPTDLEPTGLVPTGFDPTGLVPTGSDPTGLVPTGFDPTRFDRARTEVAAALDALRVLGRGIYPPRLADAGLAVSLEGWQQRSGIGIDLQVNGDQDALHRQTDVEACLYFGLVTAMAMTSGGGERPVAVVDIGPGQIAARVRGRAVAGATGADRHDRAMVAIRDRIEAFGGRFDAGHQSDDRWDLRLVVPMPDPGPPPSDRPAVEPADTAIGADSELP